jgi:hypothetical protein
VYCQDEIRLGSLMVAALTLLACGGDTSVFGTGGAASSAVSADGGGASMSSTSSAGGTSNVGSAVAVTPAGRSFLGGRFSGTVSFGGTPLTANLSNGSSDGFLAAFEP